MNIITVVYMLNLVEFCNEISCIWWQVIYILPNIPLLGFMDAKWKYKVYIDVAHIMCFIIL